MYSPGSWASHHRYSKLPYIAWCSFLCPSTHPKFPNFQRTSCSSTLLISWLSSCRLFFWSGWFCRIWSTVWFISLFTVPWTTCFMWRWYHCTIGKGGSPKFLCLFQALFWSIEWSPCMIYLWWQNYVDDDFLDVELGLICSTYTLGNTNAGGNEYSFLSTFQLSCY